MPPDYDYGFFSYDSKADFLDRSKSSGTRTRREFWQDAGVDLVIDRREGYLFWDMDGRRLIDLHLNGGTYNLGHRNPELIATLEQAMAPLRHRQPPLPGAGPHRAGRGAGQDLPARTCAA